MDFKQKFYDITHLIQQEFDRNAEKYGDKLKCRRGCSQCCSQIFRITLLDAYIIQEHIKSLPLERQLQLKAKAEEYINHLSLCEPVPYTDAGVDYQQVEGVKRLPCPALGSEGECTIYEARPVICRRFGPPIYDYKNPGKVYGCELNFSRGEEITDDELIPNQTTIGMKWDELKEEYKLHLPLNKGEYPKGEGEKYHKPLFVKGEKEKSYTTIAEAIAYI